MNTVATVDISGADATVFMNFFGTNAFTFAPGIFDRTIFVFAVIIGMLVGMMRLIDSLSGHEAHVANGERNIAVRIGLGGTVKIAKFFIVIVYLLACIMVYFNPVFVLLFLTLPLAAKAWKITSEKKELWRLRAPPLFFGNAFITEILFISSVVVIRIFEIGSLF